MTDMNEVILKADRRGRLRYTPKQKQALIEAYEASGLSGPRFAALHCVNKMAERAGSPWIVGHLLIS